MISKFLLKPHPNLRVPTPMEFAFRYPPSTVWTTQFGCYHTVQSRSICYYQPYILYCILYLAVQVHQVFIMCWTFHCHGYNTKHRNTILFGTTKKLVSFRERLWFEFNKITLTNSTTLLSVWNTKTNSFQSSMFCLPPIHPDLLSMQTLVFISFKSLTATLASYYCGS